MAGQDEQATGTALLDLKAGVYQHYKGPLYLVLGYAHDANIEGRQVVVYVGLQLDGAKPGPRLAVRDVDDFLGWVNPETGEAVATPYGGTVQRHVWRHGGRPRFRYVGPSWEGAVSS